MRAIVSYRYLNVSHNITSMTRAGQKIQTEVAVATRSELLIRKNLWVVGVRDPPGTTEPPRRFDIIVLLRYNIIVYNGRPNLCKQNNITITSYDNNNNNNNGFQNSWRNEHTPMGHIMGGRMRRKTSVLYVVEDAP